MLAVGISALSDLIMRHIVPLLAFIVLLLLISIGVLADIVGTATTAAQETPFHAKAAKRVFGARHCIQMVRNADKVGIVANDIIGDIAGTVSGAAGAAIVYRLSEKYPEINVAVMSLLMVGLVSAFTVGGKAVGKGLAVRRPTEIVLYMGKLLAMVEKITGLKLLVSKKKKG